MIVRKTEIKEEEEEEEEEKEEKPFSFFLARRIEVNWDNVGMGWLATKSTKKRDAFYLVNQWPLTFSMDVWESSKNCEKSWKNLKKSTTIKKNEKKERKVLIMIKAHAIWRTNDLWPWISSLLCLWVRRQRRSPTHRRLCRRRYPFLSSWIFSVYPF